jgi:hypothetical protein
MAVADAARDRYTGFWGSDMSSMSRGRDALRITETELEQVMSKVAEREDTPANVAKRAARRFVLLPGYYVVIGYTPPMSKMQTIIPVIRDISRGGLSCLNNSFLCPGTKVACMVIGPQRDPVLNMKGEVVRCQHLRGTVHEVGVKFAEPAAVYKVIRLERDPRTAATVTVYPLVSAALRQVQEMVDDGSPMELVRDAVDELVRVVNRELALKPSDGETAKAQASTPGISGSTPLSDAGVGIAPTQQTPKALVNGSVPVTDCGPAPQAA